MTARCPTGRITSFFSKGFSKCSDDLEISNWEKVILAVRSCSSLSLESTLPTDYTSVGITLSNVTCNLQFYDNF